MHESTLARQMLRAVLAAAPHVARILAVRAWVAETEALSSASLSLHFAAHARGSLADGANLELQVLRVEARCGACGGVYTPDHHLVLCPDCGSTEGTLLGATGFGIEALEVE